MCIKEIIHLGYVGLSDKKICLTYNLQQVHDNTVCLILVGARYLILCFIYDE